MAWDITCLTVNPHSPLPLHYQLNQLLCSAIASGELKPGDCLPPEVELVEQLGVSHCPAGYQRAGKQRPALPQKGQGHLCSDSQN